MPLYRINISFKTSVQRSNRVLEIAETFGLGLSDTVFHIFKDLPVEINQGEVVYITGQSGSGKSLLLKELSRQMKDQGLKVVNMDDVVLEDKPLIDQLGKNMAEAIELLSRAGINDANIAIRKPSELSDGQRYRFKLAKLFEQDADVWTCDEYGAILDPLTRKAVAFNSQKLARTKKVTLIVANTHDDIADELAPNVYVNKRYQNQVQMIRKEDK